MGHLLSDGFDPFFFHLQVQTWGSQVPAELERATCGREVEDMMQVMTQLYHFYVSVGSGFLVFLGLFSFNL